LPHFLLIPSFIHHLSTALRHHSLCGWFASNSKMKLLIYCATLHVYHSQCPFPFHSCYLLSFALPTASQQHCTQLPLCSGPICSPDESRLPCVTCSTAPLLAHCAFRLSIRDVHYCLLITHSSSPSTVTEHNRVFAVRLAARRTSRGCCSIGRRRSAWAAASANALLACALRGGCARAAGVSARRTSHVGRRATSFAAAAPPTPPSAPHLDPPSLLPSVPTASCWRPHSASLFVLPSHVPVPTVHYQLPCVAHLCLLGIPSAAITR
jgi:hypothetical protein